MRFVCAPPDFPFAETGALNVVLYGQPGKPKRGESARGSAGEAAERRIRKAGLVAPQQAWDFLSIALSVVVADNSAYRSESPDGWTRELDLTIAVADPKFWKTQATALASALQFLSTDRWNLRFVKGGHVPAAPKHILRPAEQCVSLLSGGLDSLVGAIDLTAAGRQPFVVSKVDIGDGENQKTFAQAIGGGLSHLALNHNAKSPGVNETSQRARSLGFLAFGVIVATSLARHHDGKDVSLYVCENGFIALNPPLTPLRVGSLSTRTAHPEFLSRIQEILLAAGLLVRLETPYSNSTKGEMMNACADQALLTKLAPRSVSCGRYRRNGFTHCGRCVPCQVRRAAFLKWGNADKTKYTYSKLGIKNSDHAGFDDVRSVGMANHDIASRGFDRWLGGALNFPHVGDQGSLRGVVERGMSELGALHAHLGVK